MKTEIEVSTEVAELIKAELAEKNEKIAKRNENRPAGEKIEKETFASFCSALVETGVKRRRAANKWADEHKKPSKPRKAKAEKKAPAKKAAPKATKKAAPKAAAKAKAPRVRKGKASEPAGSSAPASEAPAASANGSPLD